MKSVTRLFAPKRPGGKKNAFFLDVIVPDEFTDDDLINAALRNNSATYAYQKCGLSIMAPPTIQELLE